VDNGMKLAVLIDAENISSKYIKTILDEASNNGNIIYKRIYGNWTTRQMGSWREVILENSILPVQQYSNTTGKNASDSAMIIDAMDLLYTCKMEGFCIVSSDSDFTRLVTRLRESEMFVIGMGELKTPKSFINACNKFSYLDILSAEEYPVKKSVTADIKVPALADKMIEEAPVQKNEKVDEIHSDALKSEESGADIDSIKRTIKILLEDYSDEDGWMFSGTLGNRILKRFPDFDVRNFGFKKLIPLVESFNQFEVKRIKSKEDENVELVYIRNI